MKLRSILPVAVLFSFPASGQVATFTLDTVVGSTTLTDQCVMADGSSVFLIGTSNGKVLTATDMSGSPVFTCALVSDEYIEELVPHPNGGFVIVERIQMTGENMNHFDPDTLESGAWLSLVLADGTVQWSRQYTWISTVTGSISSGGFLLTSISITPDGQITVVTEEEPALGAGALHAMRLDSDGDVLWANYIGQLDGSLTPIWPSMQSSYFTSTWAPSGGIYLVCRDNQPFSGSRTLKLSNAGELEWINDVDYEGFYVDYDQDGAFTTADGDLVMTGQLATQDQGYGVATHIDPSGVPVGGEFYEHGNWFQRFRGGLLGPGDDLIHEGKNEYWRVDASGEVVWSIPFKNDTIGSQVHFFSPRCARMLGDRLIMAGLTSSTHVIFGTSTYQLGVWNVDIGAPTACLVGEREYVHYDVPDSLFSIDPLADFVSIPSAVLSQPGTLTTLPRPMYSTIDACAQFTGATEEEGSPNFQVLNNLVGEDEPIRVRAEEPVSVSLFDLKGALISDAMSIPAGGTHSISIQGIARGTYLLCATARHGAWSSNFRVTVLP